MGARDWAIRGYLTTDTKASIAAFSEAIRLEPSESLYYASRAESYKAQGYYDMAISDLNLAIALKPIFLYYDSRGQTLVEMNHFIEAIADFDRGMVTVDSMFRGLEMGPEIYYFAADSSSLRANRWIWCADIAYQNRVLSENPNDVRAYFRRGIQYDRLGMVDSAITNFEQALRIDPDYLILTQNGSLTIEQLNERSNAKSYYQWAHVSRGYGYLQEGRYDDAIFDYNCAIRVDPSHADNYYNRGSALFKQGNYDAAISDLSQVLIIQKDNESAYITRAACYFSKRCLDEAIADYSQVLRIEPKNDLILYIRGELYDLKGENAKSRKDYQRAAELGNEDAIRKLEEMR